MYRMGVLAAIDMEGLKFYMEIYINSTYQCIDVHIKFCWFHGLSLIFNIRANGYQLRLRNPIEIVRFLSCFMLCYLYSILRIDVRTFHYRPIVLLSLQ